MIILVRMCEFRPRRGSVLAVVSLSTSSEKGRGLGRLVSLAMLDGPWSDGHQPETVILERLLERVGPPTYHDVSKDFI